MELTVIGFVGQAVALALWVLARGGFDRVKSLRVRSDGRTEPVEEPTHTLPGWTARVALFLLTASTGLAVADSLPG